MQEGGPCGIRPRLRFDNSSALHHPWARVCSFPFLQPYLHGVTCVLVIEDEGLLNELVVTFQLVNVCLVVNDVLLVLFQVVHLVLKGPTDIHRDVANLLQREGREEAVASRGFKILDLGTNGLGFLPLKSWGAIGKI